jgi:hypothetical protein
MLQCIMPGRPYVSGNVIWRPWKENLGSGKFPYIQVRISSPRTIDRNHCSSLPCCVTVFSALASYFHLLLAMDYPPNLPSPESTSTRDSGAHVATERLPRVSDSSTSIGDASNGDPTSPSDAAPAKSSRRRVKRPNKKKKKTPYSE